MSKEIIEVLGKWLSIAVILAMTLYGAFAIWSTQIEKNHELNLKLLETIKCAK